jgi:hypothetical protein
MEEIVSRVTSVTTHKATRRHNLEDNEYIFLILLL